MRTANRPPAEMPRACPSHCSSACAPEAERVDAARIGRLRGAAGNSYSAGLIAVEGIQPGSAFTGGVGVNALISAEPGRPNGGAVSHDGAVRVRKTPHDSRPAAA